MPAKIQLPKYKRSVAIVAMEMHYQKMGLLPWVKKEDNSKDYYAPKWDNARVDRLCALQQCNIYELGEYFLIPKEGIKYYYQRNKWPSVACLHFETLENLLINRFYDVPKIIHPPHVFCHQDRKTCPVCRRKFNETKA